MGMGETKGCDRYAWERRKAAIVTRMAETEGCDRYTHTDGNLDRKCELITAHILHSISSSKRCRHVQFASSTKRLQVSMMPQDRTLVMLGTDLAEHVAVGIRVAHRRRAGGSRCRSELGIERPSPTKRKGDDEQLSCRPAREGRLQLLHRGHTPPPRLHLFVLFCNNDFHLRDAPALPGLKSQSFRGRCPFEVHASVTVRQGIDCGQLSSRDLTSSASLEYCS